eukprot:CAMPEP_0172781252 /NCGR_PEP_ID=MMETSP1074-20121228/203336_1 /TAXON_ID=2916 /ORGANISM="Ceratium fusus, Strain PA161109" /LENGTH=42 /DNA_ID= /DNA_START= /DNA_END= /DNA_ORIENTATION=
MSIMRSTASSCEWLPVALAGSGKLVMGGTGVAMPTTTGRGVL